MISLPASSEQWKNAVSAATLPILPVSRELTCALRDRPGLNSSRLYEVAKGDASLGLQLLSRANERARASKSETLRDGVYGLSHGVSLLGIENAVQCAVSLPTLDGIDDGLRREGLTHTLGKAHLASELAELWYGKQEGARCAAQSHFLGELHAWALTEHPEKLFSVLFESKPDECARLQAEIFGISLEELSDVIAQAWSLPGAANDTREVVFAKQRRAQVAAVAAGVTQAVSHAWKCESTKSVVEQAAEVLDTEVESVWSAIYRVTGAAARSFAAPLQMNMARTLLFDSPNPIPPTWYQTSKPTTSSIASTPQTKKGTDKAKASVTQHCASVLKNFTAGQLNLHEMLKRITKSLGAGYGLEPVVMSMLSRDRRRLVARFSSTQDDSLVRKFDIDLAQPSLFNRLLSAQQGLFVDHENYQKVWAQMPQGCRRIMPEFGFCLLPIFVRDKPIGLFYAGGFPDRDDKAKTCYREFKKICLATARALEPRAA